MAVNLIGCNETATFLTLIGSEVTIRACTYEGHCFNLEQPGDTDCAGGCFPNTTNAVPTTDGVRVGYACEDPDSQNEVILLNDLETKECWKLEELAFPKVAEVFLKWTNEPLFDYGPRIECRNAGTEEWSVVATLPAGATNFNHTTASPDTSYEYRVIARVISFNEDFDSLPSNIVSVTTPALTGSYTDDDSFNKWLLTNFGPPPNTLAGPDQDPDGDNQDNESEYLAGTDPNDPKDVLEVTFVRIGETGVIISLSNVIPGRNYTVKTSTNLVDYKGDISFDVPFNQSDFDVALPGNFGNRGFLEIEVSEK